MNPGSPPQLSDADVRPTEHDKVRRKSRISFTRSLVGQNQELLGEGPRGHRETAWWGWMSSPAPSMGHRKALGRPPRCPKDLGGAEGGSSLPAGVRWPESGHRFSVVAAMVTSWRASGTWGDFNELNGQQSGNVLKTKTKQEPQFKKKKGTTTKNPKPKVRIKIKNSQNKKNPKNQNKKITKSKRKNL